jgi:hypothetical protein
MNFRLKYPLLLCHAFGTIVFARQATDHALFTLVLRQYVTNGEVKYTAIKNDDRFHKYLAQLSQTDPHALKGESERLAFWINAYNAFTIKLIADHYPVKSIRDIKHGDAGPWDRVWIQINGTMYSLNQIEHEIIRNEFDEPRVHMALVCAARSCPPLRSEAYTGRMLARQLDENARAFLTDTSKNRYDAATGTLYLSELFRWYGNDFTARYGSAEKFALKMMRLENVKPTAVRYLPYDWSVNAQRFTEENASGP